MLAYLVINKCLRWIMLIIVLCRQNGKEDFTLWHCILVRTTQASPQSASSLLASFTRMSTHLALSVFPSSTRIVYVTSFFLCILCSVCFDCTWCQTMNDFRVRIISSLVWHIWLGWVVLVAQVNIARVLHETQIGFWFVWFFKSTVNIFPFFLVYTSLIWLLLPLKCVTKWWGLWDSFPVVNSPLIGSFLYNTLSILNWVEIIAWPRFFPFSFNNANDYSLSFVLCCMYILSTCQ